MSDLKYLSFYTKPKNNAIAIAANNPGTIIENAVPAAFIIGVYFLWFNPNV